MGLPNLKDEHKHRCWTKDEFFISTNPEIIPIASVNAAFASDEMYWATPLPEDVMRATLQNSLSFGLFEISKTLEETDVCQPRSNHSDSSNVCILNEETIDLSTLQFVGFARCITDFSTFVYLTDVYINPAHQGKGLGKWLLGCIQEVIESMPYLRRSLLLTGDWKRSVPYYEKNMGMTVMEGRRTENDTNGVGLAVLTRTGSGHPSGGT